MQPPDPTSPKRVILFLSANPRDTSHLRLGEEQRSIYQEQRGSKCRDEFEFQAMPAAQEGDFQQGLLDHKPEIVHFAGHGTGRDGIACENTTGHVHLIPTVALARLFELCKSHVKCVILNACLSKEQALEISKHIPCVIGLSNNVGDDTANAFTKGFYLALFSGEGFERAFHLGVNNIQLKNLPDDILYLMIQGKEMTGSLAAWHMEPAKSSKTSTYLTLLLFLLLFVGVVDLLRWLTPSPPVKPIQAAIMQESKTDRIARQSKDLLTDNKQAFSIKVYEPNGVDPKRNDYLGDLIATACEVHGIEVTVESAEKQSPRYHLRLNATVSFKLKNESYALWNNASQSLKLNPHLIIDDRGVRMQTLDYVNGSTDRMGLRRQFPELRLQHEGLQQFFIQKLAKPWLVI